MLGYFGGTGVNNGTFTITLGGNLITSGAHNVTLTSSGATNVTLPTSGTLVNTSVTALTSLAAIGTIVTGTWDADVIAPTYGGTGVANSSTITIGGNVTLSGAFAFTGTLTNTTNVTFPTSGTLVNTAVTTLSSLTSIGTIVTGVWHGTLIAGQYGGTGVANTGLTINLGSATTGYVLTSDSSGNATWQAGASSISITGDSGGALTGSAFTITGGTSGLTFLGSGTTETLAGTLVPGNGGTGVANASNITIGGAVTFSGAHPFTGTLTGTTTVTFPTSGTLVNTAVTTLSSLVSVGTITTGTWSSILTKYTETTVSTAAAGATHTIDLSTGNWFEITLTANCTFTISNIPATSGQGTSFTVTLIQGGSGSYTVTWPAAVTWGATGAPTLSTTVGKVDELVFNTANNGTNIRAYTAGLGFAG